MLVASRKDTPYCLILEIQYKGKRWCRRSLHRIQQEALSTLWQLPRHTLMSMSKSEKTYELEEIITLANARSNRIGCAEVTLDDWGIVDFISMDLTGARTIRCYELKISKSDFLSDAKKTFVGDFNYYVIPTELWDSIKGHVEKGVGVWVVDKHGNPSVKKKASRMKCKIDRSRVMGKILRALNRENLKHCEKSWLSRQLEKRVADQVGAALQVGDVVEYRGESYRVEEINYDRNDLSMSPTVAISPIGQNGVEASWVRPSIVKKVMASMLDLTDG